MYRIARFLQICSPSQGKTCILLQTYNTLPFIVLNFWSIGRAEQYAKIIFGILINLISFKPVLLKQMSFSVISYSESLICK